MRNCYFILLDVSHRPRRRIVAESFSAFQLVIPGLSISPLPARSSVLSNAFTHPYVGSQSLENGFRDTRRQRIVQNQANRGLSPGRERAVQHDPVHVHAMLRGDYFGGPNSGSLGRQSFEVATHAEASVHRVLSGHKMTEGANPHACPLLFRAAARKLWRIRFDVRQVPCPSTSPVADDGAAMVGDHFAVTLWILVGWPLVLFSGWPRLQRDIHAKVLLERIMPCGS